MVDFFGLLGRMEFLVWIGKCFSFSVGKCGYDKVVVLMFILSYYVYVVMYVIRVF